MRGRLLHRHQCELSDSFRTFEKEGRLCFTQGSVANRADIDKAVKAAVEKFGPLSGAFFSAGIHHTGSVETASEADFDKLIGCAQAADCLVFFTIAFAGTTPLAIWGRWAIDAWPIIMACELLVLPVTRRLAVYVKSYEGVEHYDRAPASAE